MSSGNNNSVSAIRVVIKAIILFCLVNFLFALAHPLPALGQFSAYNLLFPGRQRLPYGDNPQKSYNLSLYNLEALFASHELAGIPPSPGEYRVVIIGDSATWGYLLENPDTLAGQINAAGIELPGGRKVRAYNLGYPVMSLAKDLFILSYALRYKPDLVIWPFTLESFPLDKQFYSPLLKNNPQAIKKILEQYLPGMDTSQVDEENGGFWQSTLVGQRRALADILRLQLYGVLWAATGIDQDIPESYTPRQEDLEADQAFHNLEPGQFEQEKLAFDVLAAGVRMAGDTPVVMINEPMYISTGKNSNIRYNFYYPRWVYDAYRQDMIERSRVNGWNYVDLWNLVPAEEFTNTAVHLSPRGTAIMTGRVIELIREMAAKSAR
jgi:hypothetical protein